MTQPDPTHLAPARVCPPCNGNCRQGRDCPARSQKLTDDSNPIDDAYAAGEENGFGRGLDQGFGFSLGWSLLLVLIGYVLGCLLGAGSAGK